MAIDVLVINNMTNEVNKQIQNFSCSSELFCPLIAIFPVNYWKNVCHQERKIVEKNGILIVVSYNVCFNNSGLVLKILSLLALFKNINNRNGSSGWGGYSSI